jgi:TPP-dependent pyruvate/acetoin dehydrogenase alpha subunit
MANKIKKSNDMVWVFIGDMSAETGIFEECRKYAGKNNLPITFIIEDNGFSTDTPTQESWGIHKSKGRVIRYKYCRQWPHTGVGEWVTF